VAPTAAVCLSGSTVAVVIRLKLSPDVRVGGRDTLSDQPAKEKTSPVFVHSALDDAGLTATQFRVYCHIARRTGGLMGTFYESAPRCAAHCGVNVKTLRTAIADLLERHLIELVNYQNGHTKVFRLTSVEDWGPLPTGYPGTQLGRVSKREGTPTKRIPGTLPSSIPGTPTNRIPPKVLPVRTSLKDSPRKESSNNFVPE